MIFRPEMVKKILAGEKTVTRRPVSFGRTHGSVFPKRIELPCRYRPGRTYSIQTGRGHKAMGRLCVTRLGRELLGGIDDADAKLEGFEDRASFVRHWEKIHGSFDADQPVYRLEFELALDA